MIVPGGHQMANEIMGKTSLPMQMDRYVNDQRLGMENKEVLPEFYPQKPKLRCTREPEIQITETPAYTPEPVFRPRPSAEKPLNTFNDPEPEYKYKPEPDPLLKALLNTQNEPEPEPVFIPIINTRYKAPIKLTHEPEYQPEPVLMPEPKYKPEPDPLLKALLNTQNEPEPEPVLMPEPVFKKHNIIKPLCDYSTPLSDLGTPASGSSGRSHSRSSSISSSSGRKSSASYRKKSSVSSSSSRPVNPLDELASHVKCKVREAEDWGRNAKNTLDTACNNVKNVLDSIGTVVQKLLGG